MNPIKITARCRTVTPMLSSGADQSKFEIRAAEVKAGLRFWWRAFHAFGTKEELFLQESTVFGGKVRNPKTGSLEAVASRFSLKVSYDGPLPPLIEPGGRSKHGNDPGTDVTNEWGEGVRYCFFPILKSGKDECRIHSIAKHGRPVLRQGFAFDLRFSVLDRDRQILAEALRALWLLTNFGGLGGRTRRGAGAFVVTAFKPTLDSLSIKDLLPEFLTEAYENPKEYLEAGLAAITARWPTAPRGCARPGYTAFRPGHSEILVFQEPNKGTGNGALKAMDAIGLNMKKFRYINPFDEAMRMHHALTDESPSPGELSYPPAFTILEKAQAGLPIIYNFRGKDQFNRRVPPTITEGYIAEGSVFEKGEPKADAEENARRRASPLIISCHEFKGSPYAVICHFPAPILPEGQRIWLKSKVGKDHYVDAEKDPPDYGYIDRMVRFGDLLNGKTRPALKSAFEQCWELYVRDRSGPSQVLPEPDEQPPEEMLDPEERKLRILERVMPRKDGLPWYLGEFCGHVEGAGKNRRWPCILWRIEQGKLTKEPDTWYIRDSKRGQWPGLKTGGGEVFLATKQPDPRTRPEGNFLHNIENFFKRHCE